LKQNDSKSARGGGEAQDPRSNIYLKRDVHGGSHRNRPTEKKGVMGFFLHKFFHSERKGGSAAATRREDVKSEIEGGRLMFYAREGEFSNFIRTYGRRGSLQKEKTWSRSRGEDTGRARGIYARKGGLLPGGVGRSARGFRGGGLTTKMLNGNGGKEELEKGWGRYRREKKQKERKKRRVVKKQGGGES